MRISTMRLTCKCGHVFNGEIVTEAPLEVAIASMNAARCPKCGSNEELRIGGELGGKPPVTAPETIRARWWIRSGDVGVSSQTIYSAFMDEIMITPDVPHDPEDYGRCRALLELFPEWRKNLTQLTKIYFWFRPFVERWDEMDRLWEEESPSASCPKLYALMQIARKESEILRYPKKVRA